MRTLFIGIIVLLNPCVFAPIGSSNSYKTGYPEHVDVFHQQLKYDFVLQPRRVLGRYEN